MNDGASPSLDVSITLPIRMAEIVARGAIVTRDRGASEGLAACADAHRGAAASAEPGSVHGVQDARSLFRALGIDPTRRRPSSEALLNRALKGTTLPRINNVVDVGNWCSLEVLLPLGLYDLDRIQGPVVLRCGVDGEGYDAIGGKRMNLAGRYLLADDFGPFGSPITDSLRTAVGPATTSVLVLLYAPLAVAAPRLEASARVIADRLRAFAGATETTVRLHEGESA